MEKAENVEDAGKVENAGIMENEKISVIMGIYNCAEYLPAAVESILAQTYTNWELILCDDASTDKTYEIAEKYKDKYPDRIILLRNKKNRKLAYSLNRCLKHATGKYVARMDGDDMCRPDRFEKQVGFLRRHREYDLVGTAMQRFDANGPGYINYSVDHPDYYTLRKRNPFHHATILTYKYVYDKVKGYTVAPRTERGQDIDLWFKFYHEGFKGYNLREPLYLVREDRSAVRRRSAQVRVNAFKTKMIGFRLLNYPRHWILVSGGVSFLKCLVPYPAVDLYRWLQKELSRFQ